jgi:hypothetical protein
MDPRSEGRFSIGSTGHKNMYIGLGLNGLKLEAKAGIVGGSIDLGKINAYCHLREDNQTDPFHEVRNLNFPPFSTSFEIQFSRHFPKKVRNSIFRHFGGRYFLSYEKYI